jgi:hypothetical protein
VFSKDLDRAISYLSSLGKVFAAVLAAGVTIYFGCKFVRRVRSVRDFRRAPAVNTQPAEITTQGPMVSTLTGMAIETHLRWSRSANVTQGAALACERNGPSWGSGQLVGDSEVIRITSMKQHSNAPRSRIAGRNSRLPERQGR